MYQLRGRLGRWGFGELYEAVDSASGTVRMLKVVRGRRAGDAHIRRHMSHEFQVAQNVAHDHLIRIHSLEETPQIGLYHVMDRMEGQTLASALKKGVTFLPEKALDLVWKLASALAALERAGYGHYEFGPDAVFLWERPEGLWPLVINCGLPPDPAQAPPPLPLEVLAYAAPERKTGTDWDTRADVFSLSAVLLQLLVGRPPPPQGWVSLPPPPADKLAADLYGIARRGLAPAPGQRYPSVEALASALRFLVESTGDAGAKGAHPSPPRPPEAPAKAPPGRKPKGSFKRTVLGMPAATTTPAQPGGPVPPAPPGQGAPSTPPSPAQPAPPSLPPTGAGPGPSPAAPRPKDAPSVDGAKPLDPEFFPGGDTGAVAAYDPSEVAPLPMAPARRPKKALWIGLASGLVALVLIGAGLAYWKPWASGGGSSTGTSTSGKAQEKERKAADAGQPGTQKAQAGRDAGAPRPPTQPVARDAGVARPTGPDAGPRPGTESRPEPRPETPRPAGTEKKPKSKFETYLEEGKKALRKHKYRLARRFFTKALHIRRGSARVKRLMGEAHYRAHEYAAARYWFEEALKKQPRSASLNARLGKVYAHLGKRSKACRYFLKALHLRPNSRRYRLNVENYRCR